MSGCLKEDAWCPVLSVGFAMNDDYLEGDYDSRIKNDVQLYIFNEEKLVYAKSIPYAEIAGGTRYEIEKTPELLGNLRFVAWAVKDGETDVNSNEALTVHHPQRNPAYELGADWNNQYLVHTRASANDATYIPTHHERYIGTLDPLHDETWEDAEISKHDIILTPAPGRIKVNISDPVGHLGQDAHVIVEGGMSRMGLGDPRAGRAGRVGSGTHADVRTALSPVDASTRAAGDETTHSTDIFGVLPTEANSDLTVHIMNGDELIQTLSIGASNANTYFDALHSGDYVEFNYVLEASEFRVNIVPWAIKIVDGNL